MAGFGFGKSKSKSQSTSSSLSDSSSENANYQESGNQAYDELLKILSPTTGYAAEGGNAIADLLFGGARQNGAFENFRKNSGYDFLFNEGQRATSAPFAARGLGNSGAHLKALTKYGQGMASTSMQDYIGQLLGLSQLGLGSGSLVSDAGKYGIGAGYGSSKSHSESASQSTGKSSSFNANGSFG